jgi:Na+/H+-translocating membrane pyrophosphatase
MQFIKHEYGFCLAALIIVLAIVWLTTEKGLTTSIAVLIGGLVNMISSYLALFIATQSNYRIAFSAKYGTGEAFRTTYKACCAIGFGVCSFITLGKYYLIKR